MPEFPEAVRRRKRAGNRRSVRGLQRRKWALASAKSRVDSRLALFEAGPELQGTAVFKQHRVLCTRRLNVREGQGRSSLRIPKSDYSKYEFDHFFPLNAGGSDDMRNIWPQPLAEAHEKDKVEDEVYTASRTAR
jgi:hypothetical protein